MVYNLGFAVQGSAFSVQHSACRVQGPGCRFEGVRFKDEYFGLRVEGGGFRVQVTGFRVSGSQKNIAVRIASRCSAMVVSGLKFHDGIHGILGVRVRVHVGLGLYG